ncbi:MAG: gephyrin-like molybdotransferase Glp [Candidatus Dormiibacterota bacterium]
MSARAERQARAGHEAPLSVAAARRRMLAHVPRLATEKIAIDGLAANRVLAADVVAQVLLPPWNTSAMDGYAVRAQDVRRAPLRLPVVGEMAAGTPPGTVAIGAGSCAKVMTGAPLPDGADAVVPYEWTDRGATKVNILQAASPGNAVRQAGEDLSPGDPILAAGHRLRPTDLAAVAASGLATIEVSKRPRVAVVTTGDEIRPPGSQLEPGQIYDTAGPALEALISSAGGEITLRLRVGDDPRLVEAALEEAAGASDVLVTVGGVSVGDHDHVRATVGRLGKLWLWRVAMRPGRPIAFGELGGSVFLGLPGNPVSANVTFVLFGAPCLLAMQGASRTEPLTQPAELLHDVEKPEGLETFHRAQMRARAGKLPGVRLTGTQSSGATISLARADALLVLPAKGTSLERGTVVQTIPL